MEQYIEHHGILGMRWGVRRYQNYDGSYTREGMRRYRISESNYHNANNAYKSAKEAYKVSKKNGTDTSKSKSLVRETKQKRKEAKDDLNRKYDQLKRDKMGDKGKKLYQSGRTITGDSMRRSTLLSAAGLIATGTSYAHQGGLMDKKMATAAYSVAAGLGILEGLLSVRDAADARNLRAYYGHSRRD